MMEREYSDMIHMNRPEPIRPRQSQDNRAKQFQPFDALRGFSVAVLTKEKERQFVPRIQLTDDAQEELERRLNLLQSGDSVLVTYFRPEKFIGNLELGSYVTEIAAVLTIDEYSQSLVLSTGSVPLCDLYDLRGDIFRQMDEQCRGAERTLD